MAEHIADKLSAFYESNAVDGYLMFPFLPTDFETFTRGLVPLLQAKGELRQEYTRDTEGLLGLKSACQPVPAVISGNRTLSMDFL